MLTQTPEILIDRSRIEAAIERARCARNAEVARLIGLAGQQLGRALRLAGIAAMAKLRGTTGQLTRHA